ncbi:hypothetical protein [Paraburkholderia phenazinium]|uniref:hypothetical protein n=1 Tax=Paraburkholderia phenazinium TaxID=60549 RepID=UPI00158AA9FB|nr:hypothetical protein [Paraburkholderia phenazinium]
MFLDLFVVPLVAIVMLLIATWRLLARVAYSHDWPVWFPAAAIGLFVLSAIVANLLMKLRQKIRTVRTRREMAVMQQRYPNCHVTQLSNGQWFLTDRETGREYDSGQHIGHTMPLARTRDAGIILQSLNPEKH